MLLVEEDEYSSRLLLWIEEDKVISDNTFKEMHDVKPDALVEGFEYIEKLTHA